MAEEMKTEASTNKAVKQISESVDHLVIVKKIKKELDELYLDVGKSYVNGSGFNGHNAEKVKNARRYQSALDVIEEVMSWQKQ